jgi:hypothetical protein
MEADRGQSCAQGICDSCCLGQLFLLLSNCDADFRSQFGWAKECLETSEAYMYVFEGVSRGG